MQCGCHCIKCGGTDLKSNRTSEVQGDGYYDIHHTCQKCNAHFDHLEGEVFASCDRCDYKSS